MCFSLRVDLHIFSSISHDFRVSSLAEEHLSFAHNTTNLSTISPGKSATGYVLCLKTALTGFYLLLGQTLALPPKIYRHNFYRVWEEGTCKTRKGS